MRRARDSRQRHNLLNNLAYEFNRPERLRDRLYRSLQRDAFDELDLFDISVFREGFWDGYEEGRERGTDAAFDHVYGKSATDVASRVKARRSRRKRSARR
jgi:hypothetical protein